MMTERFARLGWFAACTMSAALLAGPTASAQTAGWAPAQSNADGGASGDGGTPGAQRALLTTNCNAPVQSRIRTENVDLETSSTNFVTVPGANIQVIVAAGTTRCIKVVFTGEAGCAGSAGTDFCYVRAIATGAVMNPNGGNEQVFSSEDTSAEAHAYEWITRLGPGTYNISVQGRVDSSATDFYLDDWTFEVETLR